MQNCYTHLIPDSREGWANSVSSLLSAYIPNAEGRIAPFPRFDYSQIRPRGAPIKTFGGVASGPEPLEQLHKRIREYMTKYLETIRRVEKEVAHDEAAVGNDNAFEERMKVETFNRIRTCVDIVNAIACCVVSAGVRRSSLIALGDADDEIFCTLKDYSIHPERMAIGGQSNNSLVLRNNPDFETALPKIARLIKKNGEPGFFNLINVQRYGRLGKDMIDKAILINPCGEIPLESFELCNLAEVFMPRCYFNGKFSTETFKRALLFATFYCSTVTLLPTHRPETNRVISRNRRIGVSLSGIADFYDDVGMTHLNSTLDMGYNFVGKTNRDLAESAGVPSSVRITTVKPSGSISQLVGVSSGMHFPSYRKCIRRIRVTKDTKICKFLIQQGVPHEPDAMRPDYTEVFEFPIDMGKTRKETEVSMWEQASLQMALQRWWADNAVSGTIKFDPQTTAEELERLIAIHAPHVKGMTLLPHLREEDCINPETKQPYPQMPYEHVTDEKYDEMVQKIGTIDWGKFSGSDGIMPRYCTNESCEI